MYTIHELNGVSFLPTGLYIAIVIKTPTGFSCRNWQGDAKICMEKQKIDLTPEYIFFAYN